MGLTSLPVGTGFASMLPPCGLCGSTTWRSSTAGTWTSIRVGHGRYQSNAPVRRCWSVVGEVPGCCPRWPSGPTAGCPSGGLA